MVLSHTVKPVGIGSPNPLDEETKPLRWMPHRKLSRLSVQRSDMSIAARHIQSPRSRGAQCGIVATVKPVGVGSPNPLGEVTSPLRWMPHRKLSRLSLQRSDMSIAARHVQSPRSRGAQCGIVAHR